MGGRRCLSPPLVQKSCGYNEIAAALSKTLMGSPGQILSLSPVAAVAVVAPGDEHVGPVGGEGCGDECVHADEGLVQIVLGLA